MGRWENRFVQWCRWRRLEVPTGPWIGRRIGCPPPLANFLTAFAPVQWATCQRLLCGAVCTRVRAHSASVRVGLFQRLASTRSRARTPSRAASRSDCKSWTFGVVVVPRSASAMVHSHGSRSAGLKSAGCDHTPPPASVTPPLASLVSRPTSRANAHLLVCCIDRLLPALLVSHGPAPITVIGYTFICFP